MLSIRYIDMRIGYYRSTKEKFWANHGIAKLHPVSTILSQIKQFVDATNEIVIVDFQGNDFLIISSLYTINFFTFIEFSRVSCWIYKY